VRGWQDWAKGESTPTGVNTGDAPPVGSVSTFRSTDGQPAVPKQYRVIGASSPVRPVTVRSCHQTVEVGTWGVGVHIGIGVPHLAMVCSTLRTLVPWRLS
jgi:hypothetical protein